MKPYRREQRLKKIGPFYDDDLIKARRRHPTLRQTLSHGDACRGIERAGDSERDIVRLDPERRGNRSIKTPDQLEAAIEAPSSVGRSPPIGGAPAIMGA